MNPSPISCLNKIRQKTFRLGKAQFKCFCYGKSARNVCFFKTCSLHCKTRLIILSSKKVFLTSRNCKLNSFMVIIISKLMVSVFKVVDTNRLNYLYTNKYKRCFCFESYNNNLLVQKVCLSSCSGWSRSELFIRRSRNELWVTSTIINFWVKKPETLAQQWRLKISFSIRRFHFLFKNSC